MNTSTACIASTAPSAIPPQPQAKEKYRLLKKKFKFLVYENECYQEELRNLQRRLLKLSRDKNFLLDRLMQYEKVSDSSDDSDPPTPAPKTGEPAKPKKQKKAPTAKKSRAKQPAPDPNAAEAASPSKPSLSGSGGNAASVRARNRKGNANGAGSSSDVEMIAATTSVAAIPGPVGDAERIHSHVAHHYPPSGAYEQHLPPQSVPPNSDQN